MSAPYFLLSWKFLNLMKSRMLPTSVDCAFGIIAKMPPPNPLFIQVVSHVVFWEFCSFASYIQVCDPFGVSFCGGAMSVSGFIFCASGAVVSAPSVGRTASALRCCLSSRVRDDLMLFMQVCFQALCSVPLTHFSLLPASPHALGDCSFRGCLRLGMSVLQPGSSPIQCFSIHCD